MSLYENFRTRNEAEARSVDRTDFIRLVYAHLGAAVLAFVLLTTVLVKTVGADMLQLLAGQRYSWLIVLGGFMLVGKVAEAWATGGRSIGMQYAGLALYVVAESIIFVPICYIAAYYSEPGVLPKAALMTLITFGGLTATVFMTKKDFSFMGRALTVAGFAAMGIIIASIIFGFSLGLLFTGAMILLMAGYILYHTSNVLHHYPVGSHVAAALALFASLATLFWYILRLVMDRR